MFTGIVDAQGQLTSIEKSENGMRARIEAPYDAENISLGASISCDGVCLTVVDRSTLSDGSWFDVDISPETMNVTNLKDWIMGKELNLERAMKMGDEIGGHIVSGHIDGLAEITDITHIGENTVIKMEAPKELARFIAAKGSVCLNGTSLTVNNVEGCVFDINLIPHTLSVTSWKSAVIGDNINLEIDMLARYVSRLREFESH
jgi:riboflavin synthase